MILFFFPEALCLGEFSTVVFQECFLSLDSAVNYKLSQSKTQKDRARWAADALLLHVSLIHYIYVQLCITAIGSLCTYGAAIICTTLLAQVAGQEDPNSSSLPCSYFTCLLGPKIVACCVDASVRTAGSQGSTSSMPPESQKIQGILQEGQETPALS